MNREKLEQYRGILTASEIAAGMNAARTNARRLVADAKLLLGSGSYPTAFALAVLSIEESGKIAILRELALARNDDEARECWRGYRSHTRKNALWPLVEMVIKGARRARDFASLLVPDAEHTHLLDQLKQISLYTDCYRKGHWSLPEECIEKELAEGFVRTAENLASERQISVEEVDLWISYLQPVWKMSRALMEQALFEWDREMRKRGLIDTKYDVTMETFFKEGFRMPGGEP